MASQYVKFLRGSIDAYKNLSIKDNDTLYFIKNVNDNSAIQSYSIYLGDKPISGGSLENLIDLNLSNLKLNDLLLYDSENKQWVNKDFDSFVQMLKIPKVFTGAVGGENGSDGTEGLVPVPTKDQANFFLKGDGTWSDLTPIINAEIAKVVDGAPEAFDTLKEISDWILNDETGAAALATKVGNLTTKVGNLEDNIGDLKNLQTTEKSNLVAVINSLNSKIDDAASGGTIDLNNYVSKDTFVSTVGSLENLGQSPIFEGNTTIVNEINKINDRLVWKELDN